MKKHFTKENIQMENKHTKRCQPLRKCNLEPWLDNTYYLTNAGVAAEKLDHSCLAGRNVK
jgi:hypothetical protein